MKLKIAAKLILAKYRPKVVGITGSVGKTSAKEAAYTVIKNKFRARRSVKNYNNEIGVPLTIIGEDSPGRSIFGWIKLGLKIVKLLLIKDKNYPEILILEMGVDRPGDMDYLNKIIKCDVGVITMIGPSHIEFFHSLEKIRKEKGKLIENLNKSGWAVLNYDNEMVRQIGNSSRAKVITYGLDEKAKLRADSVRFSFEEGGRNLKLKGINFKLGLDGSYAPVFLPEVVGRTAVYAALAGAAVGIAFDMNLLEITKALRAFKPPKGRMNIVPGIKHTVIIDDTYNSSPQSSLAALEILKLISLAPGARRFAVLGDMLELGSFTEEGHRQVGKYLVESNIDKLITVGERSRDIGRGAEKAGMKKDNIFHFPDADTAGRFAQERIRENDLILVKGSQGMRMEKIVKEIMAEPLRAKELLVRQGEEWEGR